MLKPNCLVYYPTASNGKHYLSSNNDDTYPLSIEGLNSFTVEGKIYERDANPSIFLVNQENYEKLVVVYPDLEKPDEVRNYNEVFNFLITLFDKGVLAHYSDHSYEIAMRGTAKVIDEIGYWDYLVPINPYTLKPCSSPEEYFVIGENQCS